MADDCLTRLMSPEIKKQLFGEREVPDRLIKRVVDDIQEIKRNLDNGTIDEGTYKSRVQSYIADQKQLSENQLIMRAEGLRKIRENTKFLEQPAFKKDPAEGFKALLTKTVVLANKGNQSVMAMTSARLERASNFMTAELTRLGHMELFLSDKMSREVYLATEAFSRGVAPDSKLPKEAIEMGEVLHKLNQLAFKDLRNAGIPVRNLEGYVTRQTHNIQTIRDTGFEKWFADTLPKLDQYRTFGVIAGDMEKMAAAARAMYTNIVAGRYGMDNFIGDADVSDNFIGLGAEKSLSERMSEARTLHFKDGGMAYDYSAQYGRGSLAHDVYQTTRYNARAISLFERLGDKPKAALEGMLERRISALKEAGDVKGVERLESQKNRIRATFDQVTGMTSIPGSQTLAKIGSTIGTMETLSKLWNIGIRSGANFAGQVVEMKNSLGQGYLETLAGGIKEWIQTIPEAYRRTWGSEAHEFLTDMQNQMIHESDMGMFKKGGNKAVRMMMKYNGQDFINNAARVSFAQRIQRQWANLAGGTFDSLPAKMQASLLTAGIDKNDWSLFSKVIEKADDGKSYVTPEAISRLTAEDVAGAIKASGRRISAEKYIDELELKVRGYFIQAGDVVTTTAGPRELSRLNFGTQRGTFEGEFLRLLTRFKSFTLQSLNIAQKFMNSNPDVAALKQGVAVSQGKDMRSLAEWVVLGSVLAYGADTLIRASQGKDPKNPKSPETWLDSMAQSGAGGVYVDFFSGEWDRYGFTDALMGPTVSSIGQAAKITTQVKKGNFDDAGRTATKLVRSYIPFQQAIGMKQGLDYLQYKVVGEALNPGVNARYELKQMRKKMRGDEE